MPAFVSYSFQDEAVFSAVSLALEAAEIDRWDSASMLAGESLANQLRVAIERCEICIFIATRRSIESPWCLAELGAFWGAAKRVLLFMADPDLAENTLPPQFKGALRVNNARSLISATKSALSDSEAECRSEGPRYEFFRSCGEYGTERQWSELLDQSKTKFAALGVTCSAWRRMHQFDKRAISRAEGGCEIRFLFIHPENPLLEGVLYKGRSLESVKPLIAESIEYFRALQAKHENVESRIIRYGLPHFSVARSDQRLVLTQYIASETWGSGPTWRCVQSSPLFETAMNDFEQLWYESVRIT